MLISKQYKLSSSHVLPNHPGKCHRLHGHNFKVDVMLKGWVDPVTHLVMDYNRLDEYMAPMIELLDHQHLNYVIAYPSAENIAFMIAWWLGRELQKGEFKGTVTVAVSETDRTWAVSPKQGSFEWEDMETTHGWRIPRAPHDRSPQEVDAVELYRKLFPEEIWNL